MLGSLYSGASGVKSHSKSMTVTGSNIANVNTLGYKFNRVNFEDLMATSLEGDTGNKIGKGVSIGSVQNIQTQGSFEQTELETDVAIDGSQNYEDWWVHPMHANRKKHMQSNKINFAWDYMMESL